MSVLVLMEQSNGVLHPMSWEALVAGQHLAAFVGSNCDVGLMGAKLQDLATEVADKSGGRIFSLEHPLLEEYTADGYAMAAEQLIHKAEAKYVVFPHTYTVRDFAPKVATRFGRVLVSDVIGMEGGADGQVTMVRQMFQGKLNADATFQGEGPHFASVQAGAFRADQLSAASGGQVIPVDGKILPERIRTKPEAPFRESARAVDLGSAELIVSVGRGIKEQGNLNLIEKLAEAMGAELAASRPICDNGWLPMERQVGSSGQTVSPKLYMAVGISGAIQHLVGMKGAKTIVAINKDPEAPIFEIADYGIVGDLFEVVPALLDEIKKMGR